MNAKNEWIIELLGSFNETPFYLGPSQALSYKHLVTQIHYWQTNIQQQVKPGQVVALIADYSPDAIALFLALICNGNIVVPLDPSAPEKRERFTEIAEVNGVFDLTQDQTYRPLEQSTQHPLLCQLQQQREAGIVLFSSGTTGQSKATVLQVSKLLEKYRDCHRKPFRTLIFLKLDHIGGINTLFAVLFNGGTLVTAPDRSAKSVCAAIQEHQVTLLPTTPTFLNMLLLAGAYQDYDLSCLKVITYGTEVMPNSTLLAADRAFPGVTLKQTYGLTEMGIVGTRSRDNHSTWMKIGGSGVETKVVDGILWLRTKTAMLGYLNVASPFDEEGWYNTDDRVEVDGEYMRILGRDQEIINVGGEKVFPAEVESVILEMPGVRDVVVRGKASPVTGQVVTAEVQLAEDRPLREVRREVFAWCRDRLARFKIPTMVTLAEGDLVSDRYKKKRLAEPSA